MKTISEMTLAELKKYASELGLEKVSSLKKDALLELVAGKEAEKKSAEKAEKKASVKAEKKTEKKPAQKTEKKASNEAKPEKKTDMKPAEEASKKASEEVKAETGKAAKKPAKKPEKKAPAEVKAETKEEVKAPAEVKAETKEEVKVSAEVKAETGKAVTSSVEEKAKKSGNQDKRRPGRKPSRKKPEESAKAETVKQENPAEPADTAKAGETTEKAVNMTGNEAKADSKPADKPEVKQSARERLEQFALKRAQQPVQNQPGTGAQDQRQQSQNRQPVQNQQGQRQPGDQRMNGRMQRDGQNQRPANNRVQGDAQRQQGQRPSGQPAFSRGALGEEKQLQRSPQQAEAQRPVSDTPAPQAPAANPNIIPIQPTDGTITPEMQALDSGITKQGILEVMPDGFAFIRCDNFLPGENDVYVSPTQVRRFNIKTGDIIEGNMKIKAPNEKFSALLYIKSINGMPPEDALTRSKFEDLTPVFPNERIHLETPGCGPAMRMVDLLSPIGKGQRGMIVSQPKAGKTTLLKQIAKAITTNHPDMHLMILLIDERPEEVTDMKESISGPNVEVIYSTFDELPEKHKRVSEMVIERAKRLVEHKKDVVILLDSITRLARAYNLTCQSSGRTLSGGLDPAALYMPKRFFGAARNMKEGGSLTILATALVDTGSRMDDVVFEEFKGTGNMELVLDRNLSERRIFPAIDLPRSGTRRDDLLLNPTEQEANYIMRRAFSGSKGEEAVERIINMFAQTRKNTEFCEVVKKLRPMPGPAQAKPQQ